MDTNIVAAGFVKSYTPSGGMVSNVLMPGCYKLYIAALDRATTFCITESTNVQNLAQLAGFPVPLFLNFTLAQFSDAGTLAYTNTADFLTVITNAADSEIQANALGFQRASGTNTWTGTNIYSGVVIATNVLNELRGILNASDLAAGTVAESRLSNNIARLDRTNSWTGDNTFVGNFSVSNANSFIEFGKTNSRSLTISNSSDTELVLQNTGGGAGFDSPGQRLLTISANGEVGIPSWGDGVVLDGQGVSNLNSAFLTGTVPDATLSNNVPRLETANVFAAANTFSNSTLRATASRDASFTGTNIFPAGSDISFGRKAIATLVNGDGNEINVGTNVFVELSGPSAAFGIKGINGLPNRDGKLLILLNQTGYNLNIQHEAAGEPSADLRITCLTGADRTSTGNSAATLIYSAAASRWILISFDP